eukprot:2198481-Pleurochrysis_carterae.AAC.5
MDRRIQLREHACFSVQNCSAINAVPFNAYVHSPWNAFIPGLQCLPRHPCGCQGQRSGAAQ